MRPGLSSADVEGRRAGSKLSPGPGIGIRPVSAVLESVALIARVESAGSNSDSDERFSQWKLCTKGRGGGSF